MHLTGGPKSGKGQLIEELVESFGVKVISAESLILSALPKKLPPPTGIVVCNVIAVSYTAQDRAHVYS